MKHCLQNRGLNVAENEKRPALLDASRFHSKRTVCEVSVAIPLQLLLYYFQDLVWFDSEQEVLVHLVLHHVEDQRQELDQASFAAWEHQRDHLQDHVSEVGRQDE